MREETINVDVYKKTYTKQILKQYDTTRLIVGLYERSKPYDLQNKTFKYIFRRIDGSIVRDEGTVEDSRVVFDLDEICLQLSGQSEFEIQIYENEELISSFIIPIEVEPSNMDGAEAVDRGLYLKDIDETYQKIKDDMANKPSINSVALSGNKTSNDLGIQDALVSGINIKTINNQSLLGSGNINISGGSGGTAPIVSNEILEFLSGSSARVEGEELIF